MFASHHAGGSGFTGPDHDDDEQEEQNLILPHIQLTILGVILAENPFTHRPSQFQPQKGHTQQDIDEIIRPKKLSELLSKRDRGQTHLL